MIPDEEGLIQQAQLGDARLWALFKQTLFLSL